MIQDSASAPKTKGILFGTFYRPPQSDFLNSFHEVLDLAKPSRDLKRILSSFNLKQLINQATRIRKNSSTLLLDLFITNSPRNITLK